MDSITGKRLVLDSRTWQVYCHGFFHRELAGAGLQNKASKKPWPLLKGNGWYWTLEQGKSKAMTSITGKWLALDSRTRQVNCHGLYHREMAEMAGTGL